MTATLTKLQNLDNRIERSDIFSPNEIVDDIVTPSMKYLMIAYHLGEHLLSMPSTMQTRGSFIHDAKLVFKRFLDRMELLLIMNEEAKREAEGKAPSDPVTIRKKKLLQFKREKQLREQMAYLSDIRAKAAAEARARGVTEEENEVSEREREIVLLCLESFIDRAVQHCKFIAQEEELLKHHRETAQGAQERAHLGTHGPQTKNGEAVERPVSKSSFLPQTSQSGKQQISGPDIPDSASRPLMVHTISDKDDAKAPIPAHMADYMRHVNAPAQTQNQKKVVHGGPTCSHVQNGESDAERLRKPWFNPQACEQCCSHGDDDVTKRPEYAEYMIANKRGGRGQLVPACPIHGNAHPAGQCPGREAGLGGAARGAAGFPDPVNSLVHARGDRASVFRDANPYLMDLDDWAQMKQREGGLPGARDNALARQVRDRYDAHRQRVEDGLSDDEEQMKTRAEEEDEEDAAQMKARHWADWTDDNQKGGGNKNYRK
jgi:hypothetical protein